MPRSVVDEVFSRVQPPETVATGMWTGTGPDRFLHLRVPDGEAPETDCVAVQILEGQVTVGGTTMAPGRYRLTNALANFLAHSSNNVFSYGVETNGNDICLTIVPEIHVGDDDGNHSSSSDGPGQWMDPDGTVYR